MIWGEPEKATIDAVHAAVDEYQSMGQPEKAYGVLIKALTAHGPYPSFLHRLVDFEKICAKEGETLDYFASANRLEPGNPRIIVAYAALLREIGHYRKALELLTSQPVEFASIDIIRAELGKLYFIMGLYEKSFRTLKAVNAKDSASKLLLRQMWLPTGGPFQSIHNRIARLDDDISGIWHIWARNIGTLKELEDIPGVTLSKISVKLDDYLLKRAALSRWWDAIAWLSWRLAHALGIALALTTVTVTYFVDRVPISWDSASSVGASAFVALLIISSGNSIINHCPAGTLRVLVAIGGYLVLLGPGVWLIAHYHQRDQWTFITMNGPTLLAAVIGSVPVPIANLLTGLAQEFSVDRIRHRYPRIAIIDHLLDILHEASSPGRQNELNYRRLWARNLELAANILETKLCKKYPYGDSLTETWASERASGAAMAIRNLKRLITAPYPGSWEHLAKTLKYELSALACGDFGSFKWSPPPSRKILWSHYWRLIARTAFGAALPIAFVLILQPFLKLDGGIYSWAKIASLVWAALYILLTIDPTAKDKLDAARGIAEILPKRNDGLAKDNKAGLDKPR
jgi:hypothetical protein